MKGAGLLALIVVTGMAYAFAAGRQSALQPCLAQKLDTIMARSDSLVRLLRDSRLK